MVLALAVGEYQLSAQKAGFQEKVREGIHLVVGQEAHVDVQLEVGELRQSVAVTEDAPMVNTSTRDVSGLVGELQVKELPLNGRSYDLLLTLNPGVVNFTSEKTGGIGVSNSTTGNNFSVSGNRPQQNLVFVERRGVYRRGGKQHAARRDKPAVAGRGRGAGIQRAAGFVQRGIRQAARAGR